jgi:hypothetical protein
VPLAGGVQLLDDEVLAVEINRNKVLRDAVARCHLHARSTATECYAWTASPPEMPGLVSFAW